jgi:hypothetical protein
MCGDGKLVYKNVVVAATCTNGVMSAPSFISVPFSPDTLQVTVMTYTHDATAPAGGVYNVMCNGLTGEPLAQIPSIAVVQQNSVQVEGVFVLSNFSNSQYAFYLSSVLDGTPPATGTFVVSLNLRFSKKMAN